MLTIEELETKVKHGESELRKASRYVTVAFVIKDALLRSQASATDGGGKELCSLMLDLEVAKDDCGILRMQLLKKKKLVDDLEQKLNKVEGPNIVETRERLITELKEGISALGSCLTIAEMVPNPE